uniref:Uncharacterized protein n=1 Tax=Arundo donax TaxID=35708 RepID=A0A0A9HH17_ARUDO
MLNNYFSASYLYAICYSKSNQNQAYFNILIMIATNPTSKQHSVPFRCTVGQLVHAECTFFVRL